VEKLRYPLRKFVQPEIFEPTVDKMISTGDKFVSTVDKMISIGDKAFSTVEIFALTVDRSVSNSPQPRKNLPTGIIIA
jgi:hypothetical protein